MIMRPSVAPRMRFRVRRRGLGDYLSDCTGPNPNCGPMDSVCIANWTNINSACEQQWITSAAYKNPNIPATTTQMTASSPQYAAMLAASPAVRPAPA